MDLCKSTSFRIADGRLGSDGGKGAETFVSRMGSSVIDYLLVRERDFVSVDNFCVNPVNIYSDHVPLTFTLSSTNSFQPNADNSYNFESIQWDDQLRNV